MPSADRVAGGPAPPPSRSGDPRFHLLYFVLTHVRPGAVIVVDDLRHYCVRDMLSTVPPVLATCFAGEPIEENSHGIYVLRCLRSPPAVPLPTLGLRAIARSYWRCLIELRKYGTGD